jgi:phage gpG-like protein
MNEISQDLFRIEANLKDIVHRAPREVGVIVVNHFKDNFVKQGFDDFGIDPWAKRKKDRGSDIGRAILVKSGRLKNSIRVVRADTTEIVVGTDVSYARVHNDGLQVTQAARSETFNRNRSTNGKFSKGTKKGAGFTFKERNFKMPKRQFMGDSGHLNQTVDSWYTSNIQKAIK